MRDSAVYPVAKKIVYETVWCMLEAKKGIKFVYKTVWCMLVAKKGIKLFTIRCGACSCFHACDSWVDSNYSKIPHRRQVRYGLATHIHACSAITLIVNRHDRSRGTPVILMNTLQPLKLNAWSAWSNAVQLGGSGKWNSWPSCFLVQHWVTIATALRSPNCLSCHSDGSSYMNLRVL